VLVVTRYVVAGPDAQIFLARAKTALAALSARPGWRSGRIGRATDDGDLWVLTTEWDSVGAYRRALSAYEVKVEAVPLLSLAVDEVSAFEVLVAEGLGADGLATPSGLA
jgi:Antibiotic biosynthesis monooxygenase